MKKVFSHISDGVGLKLALGESGLSLCLSVFPLSSSGSWNIAYEKWHVAKLGILNFRFYSFLVKCRHGYVPVPKIMNAAHHSDILSFTSQFKQHAWAIEVEKRIFILDFIDYMMLFWTIPKTDQTTPSQLWCPKHSQSIQDLFKPAKLWKGFFYKYKRQPQSGSLGRHLQILLNSK